MKHTMCAFVVYWRWSLRNLAKSKNLDMQFTHKASNKKHSQFKPTTKTKLNKETEYKRERNR